MKIEVVISIIGMITGITGMITGLGGLILGILTFRSNQYDSIGTYFDQARTISDGKNIIYNSNPQQIETMLDDFPHKVPAQIVEVINFYHRWGLMLMLHKIPSFQFYKRKKRTSSGIAVTRTYRKLKPIIERYQKDNPEYAEYYIYLYEEIEKHTLPFNTD